MIQKLQGTFCGTAFYIFSIGLIGSVSAQASSVTLIEVLGLKENPPKEHPIVKCRKVWSDVDRMDAEIVSVADGDTVKVKTEKGIFPIRLLSVDTLETRYLGKNQGHWAKVASDRMKKIAKIGSRVSVEIDTDACDGYGRVLGYVWKENKMLNEQILSEGLAINYCIYPNDRYCKDFADIADENIREDKAMFKDYRRGKIEIPYEWRRQVSHRPYNKYVGNINTGVVREPDEVVSIPVPERIFFMKASQVHPPYKFEEES